jgi:hypothetical protein
MAAYTPSKHGPLAGSGSYADLIASDGSNEHVIRTISIVNTSGSSRTAYVSIGSGAAATLIVQVTIPAGETRVFNGWWHVPTSTVVQVKQDTGTDVTFTASGYHYA